MLAVFRGVNAEALVNRNGNGIKSIDGCANRWQEHFSNLLNHLPSRQPEPIDPIHPSRKSILCTAAMMLPTEGISSTTNGLMNSTAPGEDYLSAEIHKPAAEVRPTDRRTAVALQFLKKSGKKEYRGIYLVDVGARTFAGLRLVKFQKY